MRRQPRPIRSGESRRYAALGHRLVYRKRLGQPQAYGVDIDAVDVHRYAINNPNEDKEPVEDLKHEGQAGIPPSSGMMLQIFAVHRRDMMMSWFRMK